MYKGLSFIIFVPKGNLLDKTFLLISIEFMEIGLSY